MGWIWFGIIFSWFTFLPYVVVMDEIESGNSTSLGILIFLILVTLLTIIIQIFIVLNKYNKEKDLQELMMDDDFTQIDDLSPRDFEEWVARLMRIQGYDAYTTKYSGDYGVDVIAEKDDLKIGIQVKKYNSAVGIKAIQEIASGIVYYECYEGWVITTAPKFTKAAINLAEKHGIKLYNKYDLAKYFNEIKKEFQDKEESE